MVARLLVVTLLAGVSSLCCADGPNVSVQGGNGQSVSVDVGPPAYQPQPVVTQQAAPVCVNCIPAPTVYAPVTVYQPYQYRGSAVYERRYPTPLRNWLHGRYGVTHYYSPR